MDKKTRKIIGPIIITIIAIAWYLYSLLEIIKDPIIPDYGKSLAIVVLLGLAAMQFSILLERRDEINGGEEDDLSKY